MAEQYSKFIWRETSPGHWEREIDEAEQFYACLAKAFEASGRMFFAITGFISISVPISDLSTAHESQMLVDAALRMAWLQLRHDHPTIASRVIFDEQRGTWMKTYDSLRSTADEYQMEQWLEQTFVPVETKLTGLEWCNSDPPAPKVPTLFIITSKDDSKEAESNIQRNLVIRSPHDIMDGIGTLQLLNNLLRHAAQAFEQPLTQSSLSLGIETANLSPPLRIAASIPRSLNTAQKERLNKCISENAKLKVDVELLTIPFTQGAVAPGKHQRTALELSSSATAEVRKASKALGASVTHIYHAAIVIFLRNLKPRGPEARTARYISYGLVNERSRCKGEYATPKHAASVYHSVSGESLAVDITIPSIGDKSDRNEAQDQDEFRTVVEQVKEYYYKLRTDKDALDLSMSFWEMGTPKIADPASPIISVPGPNPSPSVSISSMGLLDKIIQPQHGVFKASDPWVTGEELGTGLGVFLGSWEGRLSLSVAYNDAWHDLEEVDGFLARIQDIVRKGLGLENVE